MQTSSLWAREVRDLSCCQPSGKQGSSTLSQQEGQQNDSNQRLETPDNNRTETARLRTLPEGSTAALTSTSWQPASAYLTVPSIQKNKQTNKANCPVPHLAGGQPRRLDLYRRAASAQRARGIHTQLHQPVNQVLQNVRAGQQVKGSR